MKAESDENDAVIYNHFGFGKTGFIMIQNKCACFGNV